ncbi:hypothetical protein H0H93_011992 [Arthromyces matolae]|nr:hypothetical protein H0H93_011992 [Arthromyces matolae]
MRVVSAVVDSKSIIDMLQSSALEISCYSPNEERDLARTQIQKEISILLESIRMLKTRHNSMAITARLPDELLARIFMWGMSMQYEHLCKYITVAGVCTSWRRVALNCPQLWTAAYNRKQDWVLQVALPRSGAMPLRLTLPFFMEDDALSGSIAALNEMHRIRELTLCGSRLEEVVSYLTKPAPILEKLVMQARKEMSCAQLTLPDAPFANLTPRLRSFYTESCTLRSWMPLTSLSILSVTIYFADSDRILETFNMANSAPNLEYFKLYLLLAPGETFNPPSSFSKFVLARLRDFTLIGKTLRNCVTFLSLFDLPAVSTLTVHCNEDISQPSGASEVFGEDVSLQILQLTSITRIAWTRDGVEIQGNGDRPTSKTLVTFPCNRSSSSHVGSLFSTLSLLHLATLEGAEYWIYEPLRERFGSLPALLTLTVAPDYSPLTKMLLSGVGVADEEMEGVLKRFMLWDLKYRDDYTKEAMTRRRRESGHDLLVEIRGLVKAADLRAPTNFKSVENLRSKGYGGSDSSEFITWILAAFAEARHTLGAPLSKITLVDWNSLTEGYEEAVSTIREYTQTFELVDR